jgi:hypothetical protein
LGVETLLGSFGKLVGAGMPGQLQALQEVCPLYPPNFRTLPQLGWGPDWMPKHTALNTELGTSSAGR